MVRLTWQLTTIGTILSFLIFNDHILCILGKADTKLGKNIKHGASISSSTSLTIDTKNSYEITKNIR